VPEALGVILGQMAEAGSTGSARAAGPATSSSSAAFPGAAGRSEVLQGAASHLLAGASPRALPEKADAPQAPFRQVPAGWPGFVADGANGASSSEGYGKLDIVPRGGLYDGAFMPASSLIAMTEEERMALTSSTRAPSFAAATMTQTTGFRDSRTALQESGPADLPGLKRPETPILAYVDRASMPGFVDNDERESRLQQFDRDQQWKELSTWQAPSSHAVATEASQQSREISSFDQWEAELLEWKRKYGCPDVPDATPAAAAPAEANTSSASSSAAASPAAPAPQQREQAAAPGAGVSAVASQSRVSFFDGQMARQISDGIAGPQAASVAAPSSMEPSVALSGAPRQSMVDTDIDMSEMKRKSMAQRQSVLPETLERPNNPEGMERALPGASSLDADIESEEMKRKSMAQARHSVLPQDLERPGTPDRMASMPRASVLDADIDMQEMKRKSMAQAGPSHARHSVLPQDLERPGNPESMDRALPVASSLDADIDAQEMKRQSMANARRSVLPEDLERPGNPETVHRELPNASSLDADIDSQEMKRRSMANSNVRRSVLPEDLERPEAPENMNRDLPIASALDDNIDDQEMKRRSMANVRRSVLPEDLERPSNPEYMHREVASQKVATQELANQGSRAAESKASSEATMGATSAALARAEAEGQDLLQQVATFQTVSPNPQGSAVHSGAGTTAPGATASGRSATEPSNWTVIPMATMAPQPPTTERPAEADRPPRSGGRRLEYTDRELSLATEAAKTRIKPDGTWRSEYSEAGLQVRDFFIDIRKQREKDKGRQATGPLWVHLSTQAKNLCNQFSLPELLEALKLFCSVRHDDYELYMRLLGEIPHYIKQADAPQLCEMVRLLARRRLRERNYVDMVAAHLLQKIRTANDAVPVRVLVKTANAFAALECRSNPKFVEHFLRHMEHRVQELDAENCCLVSTVFVANYMIDSLRRAYLERCAETQAGFGGPLEDARCIAQTELVLRKEHHSLVVSLPNYVIRYLDKVRKHALFDKFGTVTLPPAAHPDGPKGSQRTDMSVSLQRKASTATGGASADVFSSDMHRDVSACLTHLGIEHENGSLSGPYLLDIVALDMVTPTKKIIYEVNSPHHYYEGTQQLTAEKRLRHRMLGRLGHHLHHVNAEEWRALSAAQKMTKMLKMQQEQQELNAKEEKIKAAANTMRAPLPALSMDAMKQSDPMKLKSISSLNAPIRVPVPPSQRARQAYDAKYH